MRSGDTQDRLGPYVLHELLGQGPAGTVYRATESVSSREVALKLVTLISHGEDDTLLRDLHATNEIHVATNLRHPGIVRVFTVDAIGEQSATEMEYVRGMSLRDLLGIAGRLLPERALALAAQILDALAYAHARGALHRDLKPTNILVRHDGLVKLSDFGFRESCADPKTIRSTPVHSYAAPEELEDTVRPDRQSDIWSVGMLLFQTLTGRLPFPMTDPHDLRAWQRGLKANEPSPLTAFVPELPSDLQQAVSRALKYDPSERYANAREFLNALLATGLCAGMVESDEDLQERQEATYKRIDHRLRQQIDANDETRLPALVRAFSESNPDWEDTANLLQYADVLEAAPDGAQEPEPHAIGLTPEEIDHLEEIETRLKSLLPEETGAQEAWEEPTQKRSAPGDSLLAHTWSPKSSAFDLAEADSKSISKARFETLYNPKDGAELVFVPAGEFIMGSNGYSEDNAPKRLIMLDGFCIYKYLVTVAQYRRYCEETGYPMPHAYWEWEEMDPIVGVTWHEASAYCDWADARLPTEAQWEKAARGVDGRAFPWGDQFDQRSDHRLIPKNAGKTLPVGSYPAGASPYGLMDMVGNVQQWCQDLYDDAYYKSAPSDNPPGPVTSGARRATKAGLVQKLFNKDMPQSAHTHQRVVRGSSWKDFHESFAYAFRRDTFPPDLRLPWVGFRCTAGFVPARPD